MKKEPRQTRSMATVEAVIQAGARILGDQGWGRFTTNKVAHVAGVSIGSLYQYFPNKLSLIETIRQRHLDDCLAVIERCVSERKPLALFVADLVRAMSDAHRIYPGLHRVLLNEVPNNDGSQDPHSAFEVKYLGYFEAAVAMYLPRAERAACKVIGIVISDTIDGVIHNAARRGTLSVPGWNEELVRMISLYLADAERLSFETANPPPFDTPGTHPRTP